MEDMVYFFLIPGFCEDWRHNAINFLLIYNMGGADDVSQNLIFFFCPPGALSPVSKYVEKSHKRALQNLTWLDLPGKWLTCFRHGSACDSDRCLGSPEWISCPRYLIEIRVALSPRTSSFFWFLLIDPLLEWLPGFFPPPLLFFLRCLPVVSVPWGSRPQPLLLAPWIILHTCHLPPQLWNHSLSLPFSGCTRVLI